MRWRNCRNDRSGGIEGLPLQLMIMILAATLGTAIILGWMGNIEAPKTIGEVIVEPGSIDMDNLADTELVVYVTDQDGNPLEGATVILTGLGVKNNGDTAYTTTDEGGYATFDSLGFSSMTKTHGYLEVNVSKSGYGEDSSTRVVVIN